MSNTQTQWLTADLVKALKDFLELKNLLEKNSDASKYHEALLDVQEIFRHFSLASHVPLEDFIETDLGGRPLLENKKGNTRGPRLVGFTDDLEMTTLINGLESQLAYFEVTSHKNPRVVKLTEELRSFNHQVKKDYANAIKNAAVLAEKQLTIINLTRQNGELNLDLQQERRTTKKLLAEFTNQKEQVLSVKKAWWKYALVAAGIVLGAALIFTGIGTGIIGLTIGGSVLLLGSVAYMGRAMKKSQDQQMEFIEESTQMIEDSVPQMIELAT